MRFFTALALVLTLSASTTADLTPEDATYLQQQLTKVLDAKEEARLLTADQKRQIVQAHVAALKDAKSKFDRADVDAYVRRFTFAVCSTSDGTAADPEDLSRYLEAVKDLVAPFEAVRAVQKTAAEKCRAQARELVRAAGAAFRKTYGGLDRFVALKAAVRAHLKTRCSIDASDIADGLEKWCDKYIQQRIDRGLYGIVYEDKGKGSLEEKKLDVLQFVEENLDPWVGGHTDYKTVAAVDASLADGASAEEKALLAETAASVIIARFYLPVAQKILQPKR